MRAPLSGERWLTMERLGFRGLFCLVVAVSAATLANPFVESAANLGWFGRGSFTDHSNLDVLPALLCAAALGLFYVCLRARSIIAPGSLAFDRQLRDSLRTCASKPILPLLPAIFAAELIVLFSMETLEQIAVTGHPLGGIIWLGAPAAIGLVLHGIACVVMAYVVARALESLTRAAVDLALFVCAIFLEETCDARLTHKAFDEPGATARTNPLASHSANRAPPILCA